MPFTYTYTARSVKDINKAIILTISEDKLMIDLAGLFDKVSELSSGGDRGEIIKDVLSSQSETVLLKVMEKLSEPVHLKDVSVDFEDEDLNIIFWKRLGGLRLAPIVISMGEVDNPEATLAFIETVRSRQATLEKPGMFQGPLDYWATWGLMAIGTLVFISRLKKRDRKKE